MKQWIIHTQYLERRNVIAVDTACPSRISSSPYLFLLYEISFCYFPAMTVSHYIKSVLKQASVAMSLLGGTLLAEMNSNTRVDCRFQNLIFSLILLGFRRVWMK